MKRYIQIISNSEIVDKWMNLATSKGMPLVTYIKYLLNRELEKTEQRNEKTDT